jgi:hypothetical protein
MSEPATAPAVPAGTNAFNQPTKPDQSTAESKIDRSNSGVVSDADFDRLPKDEQAKYARVRRDGGGSEWRDRQTLDSAKDTPSGDAVDVSKLQPDSKHKFSHNGAEFELTGQQLQDAIAAHAADVARKATLPADPSKYEFDFPANFKVPGGIELKINSELPEAQDLARWAHRHGLSQDAFREVLAIEATRQGRELAAVHGARQREVDKLGATGVSRVTAVEAFLDSMGASGLKARIFTGQDLMDFERIIGNRVSQGAAPMPRGGREPPEQQGRVSQEAYGQMSAHEKWSYARGHNQSNMPAPHDPRRE